MSTYTTFIKNITKAILSLKYDNQELSVRQSYVKAPVEVMLHPAIPTGPGKREQSVACAWTFNNGEWARVDFNKLPNGTYTLESAVSFNKNTQRITWIAPRVLDVAHRIQRELEFETIPEIKEAAIFKHHLQKLQWPLRKWMAEVVYRPNGARVQAMIRNHHANLMQLGAPKSNANNRTVNRKTAGGLRVRV